MIGSPAAVATKTGADGKGRISGNDGRGAPGHPQGRSAAEQPAGLTGAVQWEDRRRAKGGRHWQHIAFIIPPYLPTTFVVLNSFWQ